MNDPSVGSRTLPSLGSLFEPVRANAKPALFVSPFTHVMLCFPKQEEKNHRRASEKNNAASAPKNCLAHPKQCSLPRKKKKG